MTNLAPSPATAAATIIPAEHLPLVAVVIPCWNAEKWIARAVHSVLRQDHPRLEIIVIDDGSTDKSLEVIKSFGHKIRWLSRPNLGACAARNQGLALASSSYVLFLDADDYVEGSYILGLVSEAVRTKAELTFGPSIVELVNGERLSTRQLDKEIDKAELIPLILRYEAGQTGSILWDRAFLSRIGGWDPVLGRLQDTFLALKAVSIASGIAISTVGAYVYVQHDGPDRVSRRRTEETELSVLNSYRISLPYVEAFLRAEDKETLATQLYSLSRYLARCGRKKEAAVGFNLCRHLGLRGHVRIRLHRSLRSLVGLEIAEVGFEVAGKIVKFWKYPIAKILRGRDEARTYSSED